jgi:hypothetical protein
MNQKRIIFCLHLARHVLLIVLVFSFGQVSISDASATEQFETRCGWFSNPTPGNAWLDDRHGEWIIGTQGGHQAEGDWPTFTAKQWVKTNGNYGYGCACMRVSVNRENHHVLEIKSATARALSVCRRDRSLKEPR